MKRFLSKALLAVGLCLPLPVSAEVAVPAGPAIGTVSREQGLEAWERMFAVVSHPRCANCHVGPSDRPMWSGESYGRTRPHGMNIRAGDSRIGAETLPCATCHLGENSNVPHSPPAVPDDWRLAPVEAHWFGQSAQTICNQLRDPELNGDRDYTEIAEHLGHDVILHWAWEPGGNREPAPGTLAAHIEDILHWGAAGMPCPE
ncbi:hypothetical protein [Neptunicoccus cionae]|uniref:Isoquinoline 1-oxidoreductase subunit n=1 Tax=Neptunicoccus cionae TaxID=2035344 RepID=A0A916QXR1_9RHOB|nr:hypothetical protein [Amylibacter cionae]GGA19280.1 hypothetical protein GCM10011498_20170 [Amylibacter cionae]